MACFKQRRGRWILDFYDQFGVRQRETLPKGTTKTKARNELRDREERVSKGLYVSERKALPFKKVAAEWLEYKKSRVRETTWEVTEGMVRNHFHGLNELKITRITTADIEKYITAKQEAGVHILTLRKILVTLGQIMAYAVRHRYLEYNPYREAEKPRDQRTQEKEINILTPPQIRAFLEAEEDQEYRILKRSR
jgi:integrase